MIQITPQMRVLVALEPVDFRSGIDGLAQVWRAVLAEDPMDGTLVIFRSRSQKAIKLLAYDGYGSVGNMGTGRYSQLGSSATERMSWFELVRIIPAVGGSVES